VSQIDDHRCGTEATVRVAPADLPTHRRDGGSAGQYDADADAVCARVREGAAAETIAVEELV
jgi:hypothetical protein